MEATTERMREFGAGCRRLTELIDYSGDNLPLKGLALSAVSNVEGESTDREEDGEGSAQEWEDILPCAGVDTELKISTNVEENDSKQSSYDELMRAGAAEVLEADVSELEEIHVLLEDVFIENFEKLLQIYNS